MAPAPRSQSLAVQRALKSVSEVLPRGAPFHHRSDIDPDGTWILRIVGRPLVPRLMSIDLAVRYETVPARCAHLSQGEAAGSGIGDLIGRSASPDMTGARP